MRPTLLFAFACCIVVGCRQSEVADLDSDAETTLPAVDAPPFATHPKSQPVVVSRTSFIPTISESERPATADALVVEFEKRFAVNPEDAFVELTYWGDAPQETRYATLHDFIYGIYMKKGDSIPSITKRTLVAAKGYESGFSPEVKGRAITPEPTHILEFETKRGDSGTSGAIAIGTVNGRFYFCSAQCVGANDRGITKRCTCVLEMVCRQVGANPTWVAASHEPSIECCCLVIRTGLPVRSARLKHVACNLGAEKVSEDERQGLAIPP